MHILWLSTCSHSVKATTFEGIGFVFVFQYLLTYPLVIALFVSWVIKFSSDIIFIPFTDLLSINISCSADILMTNSPKFSEKKIYFILAILLIIICFLLSQTFAFIPLTVKDRYFQFAGLLLKCLPQLWQDWPSARSPASIGLSHVGQQCPECLSHHLPECTLGERQSQEQNQNQNSQF